MKVLDEFTLKEIVVFINLSIRYKDYFIRLEVDYGETDSQA